MTEKPNTDTDKESVEENAKLEQDVADKASEKSDKKFVPITLINFFQILNITSQLQGRETRFYQGRRHC